MNFIHICLWIIKWIISKKSWHYAQNWRQAAGSQPRSRLSEELEDANWGEKFVFFRGLRWQKVNYGKKLEFFRCVELIPFLSAGANEFAYWSAPDRCLNFSIGIQILLVGIMYWAIKKIHNFSSSACNTCLAISQDSITMCESEEICLKVLPDEFKLFESH